MNNARNNINQLVPNDDDDKQNEAELRAAVNSHRTAVFRAMDDVLSTIPERFRERDNDPFGTMEFCKHEDMDNFPYLLAKSAMIFLVTPEQKKKYEFPYHDEDTEVCIPVENGKELVVVAI
jgi:hypothetical protein